MEGFLSLEQAAQQLQFSIPELSRQIEEGRVVAIVRDGSPWLSAGEVSRLKRQSERSPQPIAGSAEERNLLRLSEPESKVVSAPPGSSASPPGPSTASLLKAANPARPPSPPPAPTPRPAGPSSPPSSAGDAPSGPSGNEEKMAMQIRDLNKRCAELENRNQELEGMGNRLKSGLQETEATLKRNRAARANLENDVIALQDQLSKAKARSEALEREVQHLGSELERMEDTHNSELRRLRSKGDQRERERERVPEEPASYPEPRGGPPVNNAELESVRDLMMEKDRLLAQEYEQRAALRSQLEDKQQKYFELKARYDKEKSEWSELLAQALQNQGLLRQQIEELKARNPKGWNPFRREK